jgi:hypothetical protein
MPSNTITEFRDKNPKGRDKRKKIRDMPSPRPGNFKCGNTQSLRGFCTICEKRLAIKIIKRNYVIEDLNTQINELSNEHF